MAIPLGTRESPEGHSKDPACEWRLGGIPGMGLPRLPFLETRVCLECKAISLHTRPSTSHSSPGQSVGEGKCAQRPQLVSMGFIVTRWEKVQMELSQSCPCP